MVIVAGYVTVETQQRESYLASCVRIVEAGRAADGCLDLAVTADLVDPARVNVYERWESQEALATYRKNAPGTGQTESMLSVSMAEYDIAGERPLFS